MENSITAHPGHDSGAILQADWPAPPNVRAFTTLRSGPGISLPPFDRFNLGSRCGDDPAHVVENRARLVEHFQLPGRPVWLRQVHGAGVLRLAHERPAERAAAGLPEPTADAALTASAGTVLAILTADCLPVLLCNQEGSEVAAAHAGWRGLCAGVLEETVRAMRSAPGSVIAWLGPAAGPLAYEVGDEVRDAFLAASADARAAFTPTRAGHWLVDLYGLARQRLAAAGVDRVHGGDRCTISEPGAFFSHRRDKVSGRMATLIMMEPG